MFTVVLALFLACRRFCSGRRRPVRIRWLRRPVRGVLRGSRRWRSTPALRSRSGFRSFRTFAKLRGDVLEGFGHDEHFFFAGDDDFESDASLVLVFRTAKPYVGYVYL